MNGSLVPLGAGESLPLLKPTISIGRRPDCDVQLNFANVSGRHCELLFDRGVWVIRDLQSTNGTRVNGVRVEKKRLVPGDEITIARHYHFRIQFELEGYGEFRDDEEDEDENVFSKSLLERAGLKTSKGGQFKFRDDVLVDDEPPLTADE